MADRDEREKVWSLVKGAHSAVLVTTAEDGSLHSRPMGCLQKEFDGTLWFLTFRHSAKAAELARNDHVLVSYADPSRHDYVSVTGRARIVEDRGKIKELWNEALRVWFPDGPDNQELALLAVEVETATYWTRAASLAAYAWQYVRARLTGAHARPEDVAEVKKVQF